jgi:hypothetical protein
MVGGASVSRAGAGGEAMTSGDREPAFGDPAHYANLAVTREIRRDIRRDLICAADGISPGRRMWFEISEVAAALARAENPGKLDPGEHAIEAGEFKDAKGRSRIANLNESPLATFRLAPRLAANPRRAPGPDYFRRMVENRDLWMHREDWRAWCERKKIAFADPAAFQVEAPRARRGRPPEYDWVAIENFVHKTMDYHGDFIPPFDPGWNASRLEKMIADRFAGRDGRAPAHSTLQERLKPMLDRWRRKRSSGQ